MKKENKINAIVAFACFLTLMVIMLGAFTRLVDAGLGCPDWPGCYGHFSWPSSERDIAAANAAYPEMPVEAGKPWPEMVHRYFASSLGIVVILILLAITTAKDRRMQRLVKHARLLFAVVVIQGVFGMWTVTLKLWPQVVTLHLLGGFITLATLWLLLLRLRARPWRVSKETIGRYKPLRLLAALALLVVFMQIVLGGWTTSNYAAVACPDLPTCQGRWLPTLDFQQGFNLTQSVGPNYLGGVMDNDARVTIHFMHRIGAVLTSIVVIMLSIRLFLTSTVYGRRFGVLLLLLLFTQLLLGLANVYFQFPVSVAVLHNLVAALLLVAMVGLNYQLQKVREGGLA
ncbi:cytochrome c oxidase assembly protein subunit 15 [Sinobacterium caligoides]|uniref:Cytochrome c oxidase assembly protein subunit 15 n=1 Tax=Sinobacterium caligoides TaxID=933926 RepID=A0A3N2DHV5_9GAMM|nr:COX15/CtaA family protein [Sinobacterium caligoides]ROR98974.1 cytochrome c oxidase assembly protein subunit 15 [Sinobacterium caligoides]